MNLLHAFNQDPDLACADCLNEIKLSAPVYDRPLGVNEGFLVEEVLCRECAARDEKGWAQNA